MRARRVAFVLLVAGCGRFSFEPLRGDGSTAADDAMSGGSDSSTTDVPVTFCTTNLVGHWPLDEVAGATINNVAGALDGTWADSGDDTVQGDTMTGQRGGALAFMTGSYIVVPGFVVPSEGTFSAWILSAFDDTLPPAGGSHLMVIDSPSPRTTISFADTGIYTLRTNDVSWQAQQDPTSDHTTWFHIAATWSLNGASIYVNGVADGVSATGDTRSVSPAPLYIGTREALDRWWSGGIDDIRIYDRAMPPAEVNQLMACP